MLRRLELVNFKAFEKLRVDFRKDAFLVGPNNAGKSTVLAALRAGAYMTRLAFRRKADDVHGIKGVTRFGWRFSGEAVRLVDENLRHEFRQSETSLTLHFSSGAALHAIWPVREDDEPGPAGFFSIRHNDVALRRPMQIREVVPSIGVVPVLAPIEHRERLLSDDYVRDNLHSRLASRHLRNQLRLLGLEGPADDRFETRLAEFRAFAAPWLSDLDLGQLRTQYGEATSLDLFYEERGSRVEKEIFWIGDGMQIWLQLLLHAFRLQDRQVIVLDEPDVFLHADLQRRMVELLEEVVRDLVEL
jgi:predicted ATPase